MSARRDFPFKAARSDADACPVVVLAGNPNCGKTTIFNLLTGARQHVGNWPGVTVERRAGVLALPTRRVSVVDLPGVYSLLGGGGADQAIAREVLLHDRVDLVVNIIDASSLERHLALSAELAEVGRPMIVVLNMVDEARAAGLQPQVDVLRARLGVPVVPMVARSGQGRKALLDAIAHALRDAPRAHGVAFDADLEQAIARVASALPGHGRFDALRLLDAHAGDAAKPAPQGDAANTALTDVARDITAARGEHPADVLAAARYDWAHATAAAVLRPEGRPGARRRVTELLDRATLHPWAGVPIFLAVLYAVFVASFNVGQIFVDLFEQGSAALLVDATGHLLLRAGVPDWMVAAIAGGVGGGINIVIAFIPPIGLTFLLLALLDDCGYMARAAYAMDRFMRRLGLPGNALVPMVIGFGCNVPAIMGSRIVEDPRGRLLTVLMQPFMSCSARLTIYMAFAAVFFRTNGGQVVFLLYILGIAVALATAALLGRTALPGKPVPFAMELPPYRLPSLRSVVLQSWHRLKVFLFRVGRVITGIAVVLFLLPGVGWVDGGLRATDIDRSLLAQSSRALVPLFAPMGVQPDNWPAVSGLIAGGAAKEVVIGTLNGIAQRQHAADQLARYRNPDIGGELLAALRSVPENARGFLGSMADPLGLGALDSTQGAIQASGASNQTLAALSASFTPLSAFAYLVFVLLYVPCASTMGALRREVGWGWMAFSVIYGVALAWGMATVIYQLGTAAQHPAASLAWTGGVLGALAALVLGLRRHGRMAASRTVLRAAPGAA